MILPELTELPVVKDSNETFTGYNHALRISAGEWYDQKNMTTDYYPVAAPRDKRGVQYKTQRTRIKTFDSLDNENLYYTFEKNILSGMYFDNDFISLTPINSNQMTDGTETSALHGIYFSRNGSPLGLMNGGKDFEFESGILKSVDGKLTLIVDNPNRVPINEFDENKDIKYDFKYTNSEQQEGHIEEYITSVVEENEKIIFTLARDSTGNEYTLIKISIFPDKRKTVSFNIINHYSKLFELNCNERFIVRMGSYLCVFPDGVVYEANGKKMNPVIKTIDEYKEIENVTFQTVTKDNEQRIGYKAITGFDNVQYRVSDNAVQYYLQDSSLWVSEETQVLIFVKNNNYVFSKFKENDVIEIKDFSGKIPGDTFEGSLSGIISWNADKNEFSGGSLKILKKGILNKGELGVASATDYIVVSGYICHSYVSAGAHNDGFFTQSSTVSFKRKKPDILYACESQNRIWACSKDGHEIYASALGNPYNFYDYSGISTDSYAVNVGTDGVFTACCNYLGQPLFFKENALHYISGSYPTNGGNIDGLSYAVTTTTNFRGVEKGSEKSLAVIDNILYYKSSSGIVAFDGSTTVVISAQLGKEKYKNAVAGAYKNKYYVSMQDRQGLYHLFVYDTKLSTWCKEDNLQITQFINAGDDLLFITADGKVISVSDENILNREYQSEGDFDWFCETGNFGYSYPNNKYISRFQVRMQMTQGARATLYIQYNSDGIWHRKADMTGKGIKTFLIPVVPIRCDHMKLKFTGTGDVKIYSISKLLEEGSDL